MKNAPGIFLDKTFAEYLAAEAVNARLLQTITERCPAAAFYESWFNPERPREETSAAMDSGSVAHAILLEGGGGTRIEIIDPRDYPAKTTGAIPEGWTNKDIRAARERVYAAGHIPILKPAFAEIEAMVGAARDFITSLEHDEPAIHAAFQPDGGDSEVSMFWEDDGVPCKIRPDRINRARTVIVDYKSGDTTAEPNAWGRTQMVRMGYYAAAAFYRRGVQACCGTRPEYVFLVQEKSPPYLCSLVGMDEQAFALGGDKMDFGLRLWRKCVSSARWPTYPTHVCYPEIPPWETSRWADAEALAATLDGPANER